MFYYISKACYVLAIHSTYTKLIVLSLSLLPFLTLDMATTWPNVQLHNLTVFCKKILHFFLSWIPHYLLLFKEQLLRIQQQSSWRGVSNLQFFRFLRALKATGGRRILKAPNALHIPTDPAGSYILICTSVTCTCKSSFVFAGILKEFSFIVNEEGLLLSTTWHLNLGQIETAEQWNVVQL